MKETKCTPEAWGKIGAYVEMGNSIPTAARNAGYSWDTIKSWLARGKRDEEPYRTFREAMLRAKAVWEARAVQSVTAAGEGDWKASAWLLERRVKGFRRAEHVKHEGTIRHEHERAARLSTDDLRRLVEGAVLRGESAEPDTSDEDEDL